MTLSSSDVAQIRVITRADDAGSAQSANLAIRETVQNGLCLNVGIMPVAPEFAHAVEVLKDLPGINLGLHFAITSEFDYPAYFPLTGIPELSNRPDGAFPYDGLYFHEHAISADLIIKEAIAQLERLRQTGCRVDYIDAHMGIYWVRDYADRLAAFAKTEGLIWGDAKSAGVERLPTLSEEEKTGDSYEDSKSALTKCEPGKTYIMVGHPGYDDEEMHNLHSAKIPKGRFAKERERERRAFMDDEIKALFAEKQMVPCRYDEVLSV